MKTKSNNEAFRALFTLPPVKESANSRILVPKIPSHEAITGDQEVDAVLWLQKVVGTGNQLLIDKAMEAAARIKTPMKQLGERYAEHLRAVGAHPLQVAFTAIGFGELENQAERAIKTACNRHEALSRFGSIESLCDDTPAEKACRIALRGLKKKNSFYDDEQARKRFNRYPALMPSTIDDCLYARAFWQKLYWLRDATVELGDPPPEGSAHDSYCFRMMAHIRPRDLDEAMRALDHRYQDESDSPGVEQIIRNLVTSGWEANSSKEVRRED